MDSTWQHTTVLLQEAVEALLTRTDATYVDATFGRGGHSRLLLARLGPAGRLIAFDKDLEAVAAARQIDDPRFSIRHEGFRTLGDLPAHSAAGVLMDLGVSSPQIDNPARGFSFRNDGPLDMRMDTTRGESVAQWLETADMGQWNPVTIPFGRDDKITDYYNGEKGVLTMDFYPLAIHEAAARAQFKQALTMRIKMLCSNFEKSYLFPQKTARKKCT